MRKYLPMISLVAALSSLTCIGDGSKIHNLGGVVDSLYYKAEVLEEIWEDEEVYSRCVNYRYKNGIETDVLYERDKDRRGMLITIKQDKRDLLIKNTPKKQSAVGLRYYICFDKQTHFRTIHFTYGENNVCVTFGGDGSVSYKVDEEEAQELPFGSYYLVFSKLRQVDHDLSLTQLMVNLEKF